MTHQEFTNKYYPLALESQEKTGINALAILAQAALETGWGNYIKGNVIFGIKANKNTPKDKIESFITTEYHKTDKVKYDNIISIEKQSNGLYKYKIKDNFIKYDNQTDAFNEHSNFFLKNSLYKNALIVKEDPYKFVEEIHKAGYATDPKYSDNLKKIINMIKKYLYG